MNFDEIKKLLASPEGLQLRKYLQSGIVKLLDISKVKEIDDPIAQAVEFKAHKRAYELLNELVIPILDSATASPTVESTSMEMLGED